MEEITVDTIYSWLDSMQVVNQTKLTRIKVLKSFLGKCFTNGWYKSKFWQSIKLKEDKKVKKGTIHSKYWYNKNIFNEFHSE